jgi:nucleoside-diphosphate-sugar epimerase
MATELRVCVTGAAGFVASWLVRELLEKGVLVRGTVRRVASADHLRALPGAVERLELVEADLTAPGSFEPAVRGCTVVFHTASPYAIQVDNPQRDLVDPAVNGTLEVLRACVKATDVARVVLTSSMAAVTDEPDSSHVLTEADWNEKSTLQRNPYYLSKTMAERAAWTFVERERPSFDLVAMNPFMIMGPSLGPGLNVSNKIVADLVNGVYPGILSMTWGVVDVRDVAHAHVLAAEVQAAQGRYLLVQEPPVSMRTIVGWLREAGYGDGTKLPSRAMDNAVGNLLVKLNSYLQPPGVASYLRTHIGRVPRYDASKARKDLGLTLRPTRETVIDTARDLEQQGHISGRRGAR